MFIKDVNQPLIFIGGGGVTFNKYFLYLIEIQLIEVYFYSNDSLSENMLILECVIYDNLTCFG